LEESLVERLDYPKMTKIAQIEDKGATLAWSPLKSHADVVAVGAKVRSDDT
jgi:hypothetical protein